MENVRAKQRQRRKKEPRARVSKARFGRSKKLLSTVAEKNAIARMRFREAADQPRGIDADACQLIADTVTCIESDAHANTW